ncbi:MAG: hypothetical protein OXF00_06715 [bacterium]|nr:hypothetical protein [bacterium]
MPMITCPQARRERLRQLLSLRTATIGAAAYFGHHLGRVAPESLADTLAVGLTVGAIAYAVTFALTERIRRSRTPSEMLNRDRELLRFGISTLNRVVLATLLMLTYMGLSMDLSPSSLAMRVLAPASAVSLAWLLGSLPQMYRRSAHNLSGLDDEDPDLDGFWKRQRRFRREAAEDLLQTTDGWALNRRREFARQNDAPVFISQELAVRYGTLEAEARHHYVQLCDRPEQAEAADRLERIAVCLDQMDQLCNLEQRTKQLLTDDCEALNFLIRQ